MKNTDTKTRAGSTTPGAQALETGEQVALELQSESQHQTGKRREKMISEANQATEESGPDTEDSEK